MFEQFSSGPLVRIEEEGILPDFTDYLRFSSNNVLSYASTARASSKVRMILVAALFDRCPPGSRRAHGSRPA